jgi:hypothetical protein
VPMQLQGALPVDRARPDRARGDLKCVPGSRCRGWRRP